MNKGMRLTVIAGLAMAVAAILAVKQTTPKEGKAQPAVSTSAPTEAKALSSASLPRLVDLGADKCIPCKMMAPILDELKTTYAGRLQVDFIDVWKNQSAGQEYGIRVIPTQIFYSADGKELFRHEGFFSKEDILAKCAELGMIL
jgi:thioredoxin 1